MASNPLSAAQLSGILVAASQPCRQAIVGGLGSSAMRVRSEPFLQARYGAEGLRVEREVGCLPVDCCAICDIVETETLVEVSTHIWPLISQPNGASIFDSVNFDETIFDSGDLKCSGLHVFRLSGI
jgi:hypothetical protein